MKINYRGADGRIIELEVTEEVGQFYLTSLDQERKNERRETRRHTLMVDSAVSNEQPFKPFDAGRNLLHHRHNDDELTGDFFAVAKILGHSLKGTGQHLGFDMKLDLVTAVYVEARADRIKFVLDSYHRALFPNLIEKKQDARGSGKEEKKDSGPSR